MIDSDDMENPMHKLSPTISWGLLSLCSAILWVSGGCCRSMTSEGPLIGITSVYEPAKDRTPAQTTVPFRLCPGRGGERRRARGAADDR